jgi:ATP-binding cassette, subfamily B, bacterial
MAKRSSEPLREEDKRKLNRASLKNLLGVFNYALPYKGPFIFGLIALALSSLTTLSFPYFAGMLLNIASGKGNDYFNSINQVALVLVSILFIQAIFSFIRVYTFAITSEKSIADIRQGLYKKLIWSSMSFYDNSRVGELLSRITSDVGQLQSLFTTTLAEFLRQILTLILGVLVISILAPKLTVFMLLTFPILVVLALVFGKYIRKLSKKTQDTLAQSNVVVEESLHSIAVVKAFTNELLEILRYKKLLNETVKIALRTSRYQGLFISFMIFTIFGGIVAVGWYGALLVQQGDLDVGELFSFVIYTMFIGVSIAGLGDIYSQLQRAVGASERILEILKQPDESEAINDQRLHLSGEIAFDNVSFTYAGRADIRVLHDLNFTIKAGEKIALIGKSGSGKSTIINLIMRFYTVQEGKVVVDSNDIASYNLSGYRHNIGIVPQEVILFGGTIEENIAYGKPGASIEDIKEAARKANAFDFIESFPEGFKTLVGERGVKLSGGQRQRIAIARAILKDPAILILDEATSSLDAQSEVLVQQALEKLMEGRTTIVIAHRLSTIKKVDRIFVINDGRLAEMGSHAELTQLNNGIYNTLLKLQLHES